LGDGPIFEGSSGQTRVVSKIHEFGNRDSVFGVWVRCLASIQ
jgi:hypothetical protein